MTQAKLSIPPLPLSKHANPEQCHECLLKQKYFSDKKSKCVKHIFEEKEKQIVEMESTVFDEIMVSLQDVNDMMPQFMSDMAFLTREEIFSQIEQMVQMIDQIKSTLVNAKCAIKGSEPSLSLMNYSISSHPTLGPKITAQQSQLKNISSKTSSSLSIQVNQDQVNQYIKDWVMYFSEQLVMPNSKKKILFPKTIELPFDDVEQMIMFKQTIQRKYEQFIKKIQQKDKVLNQAINKLADYIDASEKTHQRQNRLTDSTLKFSQKLLNPVTPMRALQLSRTRSTRSTSKDVNKSKQKNPFKPSISSFILDSTSTIMPNQDENKQLDQTYYFMTLQAQSIEVLLNRIEEDQNKLITVSH